MLLYDFLDQSADKRPKDIALFYKGDSVSYGRLKQMSISAANYLYDQGLRYSDRVVILLPNSMNVVVAAIATMRLGGIFVILNRELPRNKLVDIVRDARPKFIITNVQGSAKLEHDTNHDYRIITEEELGSVATSYLHRRLFIRTSESDVACLIYTSGSTGRSKAVVCTHSSMVFSVQRILQRIEITADDIIGNFLPLSFDYGLYQLFLAFQTGGAVLLGNSEDAGIHLVRNLREWKVTGLPVVPNLARSLIKLSERMSSLPSLRFITNTGENLPMSLVQNLQILYPTCKVYVMYGLTECKRVSILEPERLSQKSGSVGRPLPDTECFIVDENGNVLPPFAKGELIVKGKHVMSGYWNDREMTARRFRVWGEDRQKVLFTGDICSMDDEGYLYYHGRYDDLYKKNGFRISSIEVEKAATSISGVDMAALVPYTKHYGDVLFISGRNSESEVKEQLKRQLETHKIPNHVIKIGKFPLNENGKVDKKRLEAMYDHE